MTGYLHLLVDAEQFTLTRGQQDLGTYTFNTGVARHLFCRHCGVKSFYVPRSHPNGYSVNVRCLDDASREQLAGFEPRAFNGQAWEDNVADLRASRTSSSSDS